MHRKIIRSSAGRNETVADRLLNRLLPNAQTAKVGPFVSLSHAYPIQVHKQEPKPYRGQYAHPNRGIVTLSFVLSGSLMYLDSHHQSGIVETGGMLWRNTGSGIIHDELPAEDFLRQGGILHTVHFWVNLPGLNKRENPECQVLYAKDIPELELPENAGVLKVLLGTCGVLQSPLKTYLDEFIYHIRLNPKSSLSYPVKEGVECAVFVPSDEIRINDQEYGNSHLVVCGQDETPIQLYNPGIYIANVFLFGGQEYQEPIVIGGPFVMNRRDEIAQAYSDFFEGRYGQLDKRPR
jgi:redox-sensitive bicupin YhaK (pirin superfamily)